MSRYNCLADADFLISLIKTDDSNHLKSVGALQKLMKQNAFVLVPVTAILEAATALLRRYNLPDLAFGLLSVYQDSDLQVIPVDQQILIDTAKNFDPKTSKHHTPFDCAILSLAKANKADLILSFDDFYSKKGFKTLKDF